MNEKNHLMHAPHLLREKKNQARLECQMLLNLA
jgi:hypothetical protein